MSTNEAPFTIDYVSSRPKKSGEKFTSLDTVLRMVCAGLNALPPCHVTYIRISVGLDSDKSTSEEILKSVSMFCNSNIKFVRNTNVLFSSTDNALQFKERKGEEYLSEPGIYYWEDDANTLLLWVSSFALHEAAVFTSPESRTASHSVPINNLSDWFSKLSNVRFATIMARIKKHDNIIDITPGESFKAGFHLGRENTVTDFKMPNRNAKTNFFEHFPALTTMVGSASTTCPIAKLWFGVTNSGAAVGIEDIDDLDSKIQACVKMWANSIFPRVVADDVVIYRHPIEPFSTINCTVELSENDAHFAWCTLEGRCQLFRKEGVDNLFLVGDNEFLSTVMSSLEGKPSDNKIVEDLIRIAAGNAKSCKDQFDFSWTKRIKPLTSLPDGAVMINHVVYDIEIKLPTELYGTVGPDTFIPCFVKRNGNVLPMKTFPALWLRSKGHGGAPIDLCIKLRRSATVVVVAAIDEEEASAALYSLRVYANNSALVWSYKITDGMDYQFCPDFALKKHVVLIVTSKAWKRVKKNYRTIEDKAASFVSVLVTEDLSLNTESLHDMDGSQFVDLIPLNNFHHADLDTATTSVEYLAMINLSLKYFEAVPENEVGRDDELNDEMRTWILNSEDFRPSWPLIMSNRVVETELVLDMFKMVNQSFSTRTFDHVQRIMLTKKFGGSGATACLLKLAVKLKDLCTCYVRRKKEHLDADRETMVAEIRSIVNEHSTKIAFVFDDDHSEIEINEWCAIIHKVCKGKQNRVVVIEVGSTDNPNGFELNPILSMTEASNFINGLRSVVGSAGLEKFFTHLKTHSSEDFHRHLFVIMHVASSGKFIPINRWLDDFTSNSTDLELNLVCMMAVISLSRNHGSRSISSNYCNSELLEKLCAGGLLLKSNLSRVSFLHPLLADMFLAHMKVSASVWSRFELALDELSATKKDKILILERVLSLRPKGMKFAPFVERVFERQGVEDALDLFSSEFVKYHLGHFCDIIKSRLCRYSSRGEDAVTYAERALEGLKDTPYLNLALNNCAEAYGMLSTLANSEDVEHLLQSMDDKFALSVANANEEKKNLVKKRINHWKTMHARNNNTGEHYTEEDFGYTNWTEDDFLFSN